MLTRILEPEVMDTDEDAREYDAMDHAAVNALFVTDLLQALAELPFLHVLDLGAGTAQIPIELCRREPQIRVTAVDAAESMLELARENISAAGFDQRIETVLADAKALPFKPARFPVAISNSILHHITEPQQVIAEALRVIEPDGLQFHRDLCRPHDEERLTRIVDTYAGTATPYQRKLFADSLRAALTLAEMQQLVASCGFPPDTVRMTSDRHWTWTTHNLD
jgi:ubiquinone/menaquinone biosynthesis C-methylase UbiE